MSLLKSNPLYREIPVVIITTEGAAEDRDKGLALGARAYIAKPIQTNNLLKVVREILGLVARGPLATWPSRLMARVLATCPLAGGGAAELFVRCPV